MPAQSLFSKDSSNPKTSSCSQSPAINAMSPLMSHMPRIIKSMHFMPHYFRTKTISILRLWILICLFAKLMKTKRQNINANMMVNSLVLIAYVNILIMLKIILFLMKKLKYYKISIKNSMKSSSITQRLKLF